MKRLNAARTALQPILAALADRGWARHLVESDEAGAVLSELGRVGDLLGARTVGRGGALEEVVRPKMTADAHPRSLSARYGLNALPFHTELSHRPRPCRYLLLGCIDPGSPSAMTMLLDWRTLRFSSGEIQLLESAPLLVRTGRRSFYSTILPPGRAFVRYDPCCLEPVNERGRTALSLVEDRLGGGSPQTHEWRRGDILVLDNWRVLHARGPSNQRSSRRLARILIDA